MNEGMSRLILPLAVLAAVATGAVYALDLGWASAALVLLALALGAAIGRLPETEKLPDRASLPLQPAPDLLDMDGFTRIIDGIADPMMVIDKGKVVLANSAARRLLGAHVVGEDVRVAIRHPAAAERLAGAIQPSGPTSTEIVGLGNRDQRWTMEIVPVDAAPERRRLLVRLIDISAAYTAERMRVDFVANASHELRTPLAAILGYVETLMDPDAGDDRSLRERFLGIVGGEARRMQQLIDDLISLSRIEADKHRQPDTPVDLRLLAQEVTGVLHDSLGKRGADIDVQVADGVPLVPGDRTQLSQLLHNLLGNSAKYGAAGTPVQLTIQPAPPGLIRIEVRDEGEGIPPQHLHRLTERFYRVDSGRSRSLGGTGLGLAIVKHIVERHRGRLDIASTPGKGTIVTVLLPAVEETQAPMPATLASETAD